MTQLDAPLPEQFGSGERVVTRVEERQSNFDKFQPSGMATRHQSGRIVTREEADDQSGVPVYRPRLRPPMAKLCALDDGDEEGEWFRIRTNQFTIGRVEGDLVVPHDAEISARHAEISRRVEEGRFHWCLKDLGSKNGVYVKVSEALLKNGQEFIVGGRRYKYESSMSPAVALHSNEAPQRFDVTQPMASLSAAPEMLDRGAKLIEFDNHGKVRVFSLANQENWMGTDNSRCGVVIDGDPYASPKHAKIWFDASGRCRIEDAQSKNGVWMRIDDEWIVEGDLFFRLGEQRFQLKVG